MQLDIGEVEGSYGQEENASDGVEAAMRHEGAGLVLVEEDRGVPSESAREKAGYPNADETRK